MNPVRKTPDFRRWRLWLVILLSLAGYIILAVWFPLRPNYNLFPTLDIRALAPTLRGGLTYALLLILLYGLYLYGYRLASKGEVRLRLPGIVLAALLFCLPLLLTYPINSTDIFRYFIEARISVVHGFNPFTTPPAALAGDPFAPLAGEWEGVTTPYGPLWQLLVGTSIRLTPHDLWSSLLIFKGISVLAFLAGAAVIWLSLREADAPRRSSTVLLWAWNPSLLLTFAMDGHNDSMMILWLLLGWLLVNRGRDQLGMIVMLLAPLTKAIGLLPLPILFVAIWRRLPDHTARIRFLIITGVSGLILLFLSFIPFGSPLDLVARLLQEAEGGLGFSPVTLFALLGWELLGLRPSLAVISRVLGAIFLTFISWLVWRAWRGRSSVRGAADVFAGYVVQALNFRIWYASWPFPWLLLDDAHGDPARRARLGAGLAFLLTSQLSVIIYGHIRTILLDRSTLAAHLLGVPFTFLAPAAVGVYLYYRRRPDPDPSVPTE